MKNGKLVGPDVIPVELWKRIGEGAVEFLLKLINMISDREKVTKEWRKSVQVAFFKNKGDVQSCSIYRGTKLMNHTMRE